MVHHRPVATPDGSRTHHTSSGSWLCQDERFRQGEPRARRATAPARSRSPDPPLEGASVWQPSCTCRSCHPTAVGFPRVGSAQAMFTKARASDRKVVLQVVRRVDGNVGDATRRFTSVRVYAHVETDTSLTLSLHARARAWEDGVGEGFFVGARSRSEDRGVQGSRAPRARRERPTNTALAAWLEYSEAHSNATRGRCPGGDIEAAA
jgi:hypothetical protein